MLAVSENDTGRPRKKCVSSKSAPNQLVMCPPPKVAKMRIIGTFCVESFAREAPGQVLGPFFLQNNLILFGYRHIPLFFLRLLTSPTLAKNWVFGP